jgi:hypothetical protein
MRSELRHRGQAATLGTRRHSSMRDVRLTSHVARCLHSRGERVRTDGRPDPRAPRGHVQPAVQRRRSSQRAEPSEQGIASVTRHHTPDPDTTAPVAADLSRLGRNRPQTAGMAPEDDRRRGSTNLRGPHGLRPGHTAGRLHLPPGTAPMKHEGTRGGLSRGEARGGPTTHGLPGPGCHWGLRAPLPPSTSAPHAAAGDGRR